MEMGVLSFQSTAEKKITNRGYLDFYGGPGYNILPSQLMISLKQ
jgi:hypothetical protein